MRKKIAIISDIHGNILALEKVVEDINRRNIDLVYNLGDHISGPLWPKETIDFLKQQDWLHISGNHDRNLINQQIKNQGLSDLYASRCIDGEDLTWLKSLPPNIETDHGHFLFHGSPKDDCLYLLETIAQNSVRLSTQQEILHRIGDVRSSVLICGHTHIPRIVKLETGQLIVNPGSVGLPAYDDDTPEYHIIENGSPHARYALLEENDTDCTVEIIAIDYDHHAAAEQARKNGRIDWEIGLRTGYMQIKS